MKSDPSSRASPKRISRRWPTAENAAYAIFTSGSTGEPKAVVAIHRALVNVTLAVTRIHGTTERDRRLAFVPIGSDVVIAEIFNTLSRGATLVYGSGDERGSVWEFLRGLSEKRITMTGIPSSWWHEWVAAASAGENAIPGSLRLVVAGMESVRPSALVDWRRLAADRVRWLNAYGPTETTLQSVIYEAGSSEWEGDLVPIGRPIANTRVYVLDRRGRPVPPGVAGELFIGGDGVSRGYLGKPELTADRFVPDPFAESDGRLYRTGDVVFWLPDGNLVFIGRADRQVKIRGYRVELDGIEAILAEHPAVRQCAVVLAGEPNAERLTAFVAADSNDPDVEELRRHMATRLPAHAVPASIAVLPRLPLTASGKIDREALQREHSAEAAEPVHRYSCSPVAWQLLRICGELLPNQSPGFADNLFDAGLDSLLAARLVSRIEDEFGTQISFSRIFEFPTIERLAGFLEAAALEDGHAPEEPLAIHPLQPHGDLAPLFIPGSGPFLWPLAKRLGRPVLGLVDPEAPPELTLEEYAARYAQTLRKVRPHGPYALAGWCVHGNAAYAIAQHLRAEGEEVALLILLDAVNYAARPALPPLVRMRNWMQHNANLVRFHGRQLSRRSREARATYLRERANAVHKRFSLIASFTRHSVEQRLGVETGMQADFPKLVFAAHHYSPKPYEDRILLVQQTERPAAGEAGWSIQGKGSLEVGSVTGGHRSMFEEPNVETLAELLRSHLADAFGGQ